MTLGVPVRVPDGVLEGLVVCVLEVVLVTVGDGVWLLLGVAPIGTEGKGDGVLDVGLVDDGDGDSDGENEIDEVLVPVKEAGGKTVEKFM